MNTKNQFYIGKNNLPKLKNNNKGKLSLFNKYQD